MAEANASNVITRYYIYGKGLTALVDVQTNALYVYHFDGTGHTVAITNASQQTQNTYAYDPYGKLMAQTETIQQPFKYAGQVGIIDEGNNLYYMRARYYDANIGRFISEDPIGHNGGLNLYAYVGGNPVMLVDPLGLEARSIANSALSDGRLSLSEANSIWRANTDPNFAVTVDASQLSVRQNGRSTGVVQGASDWLVHGTVSLSTNQQGGAAIVSEKYSFESHGAFFDNPVRNFETIGGKVWATELGLSGGMDYMIKFNGTPNVIH